MTDIPIIMSAPMVRAWLAGNKRMTRRLLYSERKAKAGIIPARATVLEGHPQPDVDFSKPIGTYWTLSGWQKVKPGDRLWVRENWRPIGHLSECTGPADVRFAATVGEAEWAVSKWRPSIHMPRFASRLTLIVGAVKIERLRMITEEDAVKEGVERDLKYPNLYKLYSPLAGNAEGLMVSGFAHISFRSLWQSLHGAGAWDANPWVVAITASKVIKANIDAAEARAA